jgi:hypothetical protein
MRNEIQPVQLPELLGYQAIRAIGAVGIYWSDGVRTSCLTEKQNTLLLAEPLRLSDDSCSAQRLANGRKE